MRNGATTETRKMHREQRNAKQRNNSKLAYGFDLELKSEKREKIGCNYHEIDRKLSHRQQQQPRLQPKTAAVHRTKYAFPI